MKATPINSKLDALEALDDLKAKTTLVDQALNGLAHQNSLMDQISGIQGVLDLMHNRMANLSAFIRGSEAPTPAA